MVAGPSGPLTDRRVVVTGIGMVSSLGHDPATVTSALREGRSGVRHVPEWEKAGLSSTVAGTLRGVEGKVEGVPKRVAAGLGEAALYCAAAARDAVAGAGLTAGDLGSLRSGCIVGSGVGSTATVYQGGSLIAAGRSRRVNPYSVLRAMASSSSAGLVRMLGFGGRSYSVSSACSTSSHAIGHAAELIRHGRLELAVCGGGEEVSVILAGAFDAMRGALSTGYNDRPQQASRPYDLGRDGFVLSGGAGILVLEEAGRAVARGAPILGEVAGFGSSSDPFDPVLPDPSGGPAAAALEDALHDAGLGPGEVDYVNTHGTGTPAGDLAEVAAMRQVFGASLPPYSSTKSLGGHGLGAAGALEAIHCLLMLQEGFVAPSVNVDELDSDFAASPPTTRPVERSLEVVLSNSFAFGGANAVLVLRRWPEGGMS